VHIFSESKPISPKAKVYLNGQYYGYNKLKTRGLIMGETIKKIEEKIQNNTA
jgi:hypothetical protein